MSAVAMLGRARDSRNRTRYTAGALTLAVMAGVSVGSVSAAEPAQADQASADAPAPVKAQNVAAPAHQAAVPARHANAPSAVPAVNMVPSLTAYTTVPLPPDLHTAARNTPIVQDVVHEQRFSKYADNLDGWIRSALDIMRANNIPGSYDGIHRNVMRESTGNPRAINLYDSNAAAGIPSKGLLQVIDPTFQKYHVKGTPFDIWDPVANIVAACNYAAQTYGSMDNVSSAY